MPHLPMLAVITSPILLIDRVVRYGLVHQQPDTGEMAIFVRRGNRAMKQRMENSYGKSSDPLGPSLALLPRGTQ